MEVNFRIPLSKNDLLSSDAEYFAVNEVYSVREIEPRLEGSLTTLKESGPTGILSAFDPIFSVVMHFHELSVEIRKKAWIGTYKAFSQHINELSIIIDPEGMDFQVQKTHLSTVKMLSYLLGQLMEAFEAEAARSSIMAVEGRKGRSKQAVKKTVQTGWDWDQERNEGLRAIGQLIELDVHRLWDPPVIEEDFVNVFTSLCYKLLENASITKVKDTKDIIFHILGILIKKYDHGLSASLKIIQLLQHFEHLVSPLAQAVEIFVVQFGNQRIIADIIREIGRMDSADLSRDSSGTRSLSQFIVELADKQPSHVLPNISLLLSHLDGDSYSMRNGVLSVIGEIVAKVLSRDDLDPNMKNTREKFLDRLEEHLHDVHAFVRSKVLQIWHSLCSRKAIPLNRQSQLLELVIGRLHDKSSQVRKYTIQLLKEFLIGNPFSAKLSVDELKNNLEHEKEKLDALISNHSGNIEKVDKWVEIAPCLFEVLKDGSEEISNCSLTIEDDAEIEEVMDSILRSFYEKLAAGKYREAISVYEYAEKRWPEHFCASVVDENNEEREICDENEDKCQDKTELGEDEEIATIDKDLRVKMALFEGIYRKFEEVQKIQEEEDQSDGTEQQAPGEPDELKKQRVVVKYLEDSVRFVSQMQKAIQTLCQLLGSKASSDILETIDFFISASEFNLAGIEQGTRKMLALIWSRDAAVKETVVNAYRKLYIEPRQENDKNMAQSVVQNLTSLTYGATLGELTSLEELLKEIYKMGLIPQNVLQLLWQRFSMKSPQTTPLESRSAILLLGMFAGAEASIVKSNIDVLVSNGLGPRSHQDFLLAFNTCTALLKINAQKKKLGESEEEPFRFPEDHEIFGRLDNIIVTGLHRTEVSSWSSFAMQAINVVYKLAEHPDVVCERLIKNLAKAVLIDQPSGLKAANEIVPGEETRESDPPHSDIVNDSNIVPPTFSCQPKVLARVLFVVGHVAFQQLVHLDVSVLSELKRRHRIQEEEKEKKQGEKAKNKTSQSRDDETLKENGEEGLDDDMGVGGAAAEDAEAEFIRNVCEKDVVTGQNLLALFGPLLTAICSNPTRYPDEELRTSASLAFSKFMLVSSEFCEANLQLLFTILEKSKEPIIRANTIIALGDLTFRFPNLIEPWTSHLYGRLSDESIKVRQTTVTVLTHLILNDMVKVKGQISEMAFCLEDPERRISDLAKLFFTEFSQKGNALYNVLPDIISRLSDTECGTDEEKFQRIMEYLLQFIQKDKQAEALVEKLCHRFRVTSTPRQWHDLAYCLSQLPFNEKCFKKLQENFVCFQESLSDEKVFESFNSIISKSKKFIKQDLKVIVEEFEEKVLECHNKAADDEAGFQRVAKASQKAAMRKNKQKTKAEPKRKTRGLNRDESDNSDADKENREFKTPRKGKIKSSSKSTNKRMKKKKPLTFVDDDENDEIELFSDV